MKPASRTQPCSFGPGSGSSPVVLIPSMTSVHHWSSGEPGLNSPLCVYHRISKSWNSTQPPGFVCLCSGVVVSRLGKEGTKRPRGPVSSDRDVLKYLLHEPRPIFDRACHVPTVDIVKRHVVCPFLFDIVDFECDVWRDATLLSSRYREIRLIIFIVLTTLAALDSGHFRRSAFR